MMAAIASSRKMALSSSSTVGLVSELGLSWVIFRAAWVPCAPWTRKFTGVLVAEAAPALSFSKARSHTERFWVI